MRALFDNTVKVLLKHTGERTEAEKERLTDYFIRRTGLAPDLPKEKMQRLKELSKKLEELDTTLPRLTQARHATDSSRRA